MIKTRFTGIFYRVTQKGEKIYYMKGKIAGKSYLEKVGSSLEGMTARLASNVRHERHSLSRLKEQSPYYKPKKITLNEGADLYFESIDGKSDTRNNKSRYDNHINDVFGEKDMSDISSEMIEKFIQKKKQVISPKTHRHYAPKTLNDLIHLISVIYRYNNIPNPTKNVKKDNVNDARERYLNEGEISKLLEAIRVHPTMRKKELITLFTVLALTTGARLSSVLSITYGDILKDKIRIKDHKNDSTYYSALHPSVNVLLQKEKHSAIDYVIGGDIKQLHRSSINKMLQPVLDELFNVGLDAEDSKRRAVIHTFRHTFGSLLAISGTPIFTIKKLMNHKKIEMTMRYAKLSPDVGFDAVVAMKIL